MRKFPIIISLIIAILSLCLSAFTPPLDQSIIKTIHPNINLYQESSLESDVLIAIPQNASVTAVGTAFYQGELLWQEIEYIPYKGYVLYNNLYISLHDDVVSLKIVKATTLIMGKVINLYESHDVNAEKIEVCDGTKLFMVNDGIDYGEFSKVKYLGNTYFVIKNNITTGLSYNQIIAVYIASSLCAIIVISVGTMIIYKKRKILKIK